MDLDDPRIFTDGKDVRFLLIGTPRCGSSMAARVFEQSGMNMGGPFLPADMANPDGYYEDLAFQRFNRNVLLGPYELHWYMDHEYVEPEDADSKCREFLQQSNAVGLKAPHLLVTWPTWRKILAPHVAVLAMRRDLYEIEDSLTRQWMYWRENGRIRTLPDVRRFVEWADDRLDAITDDWHHTLALHYRWFFTEDGRNLIQSYFPKATLDFSSVKSETEIERERSQGWRL